MNSKKLSDIRREYSGGKLDETMVASNPFAQLRTWLNNAIASEVLEPTAFCLSSVSAEGKPDARIVLLKGLEEDSGTLSFFTNYQSKKGKDLSTNNCVSVTFFWPELSRQVRIEGTVKPCSSKESDEYFASRPKESQLGALVSAQSTIIESREILETKMKILSEEYKDKSVPRPEYWGGYLISPEYFEFWQGRENRLHDRIIYLKNKDAWTIKRLAP